MADKLIRMAGQMADFFRSQPDMPPEQAVAEHINRFWTYRMRRDFLALLDGGAEADPIVQASRAFIELPADQPAAG